MHNAILPGIKPAEEALSSPQMNREVIMEIKGRTENTVALKRIEGLLDPGSFMETGALTSARLTEYCKPESVTESDGVVTGYGTIDGRLVFIFAQDDEVMGGTFGEQHGRKIVEVYERAMRAKAPVVGLLASNGVRIEEGLDALEQFAKLYKAQSAASGKIPQIMAVTGKCGGGMAAAAKLADFLFVEEEKGEIFVTASGVADGSKADAAEKADGKYTWDEIAAKIKSLVAVMPPAKEFAPEAAEVSMEELNRVCEDIDGLKGKALIEEVADGGEVIETGSAASDDMVTGIIRIGGVTAGAAACTGKRLTSAGLSKFAELTELCSRFNLPMVTFTDTEGFSTEGCEESSLPGAAAWVLKASAKSDVPKVNVITGKAAGSTYSLFNSKGLGADYVFIWEGADVSIIDPRQATEILYGKWSKELEQEYRDAQSSAAAFARHGYADKVIAPEETRKYIIGALQTFVNSR